MQSSSKGARQKVGTDKQRWRHSSENLLCACRRIDSLFGFHRVQTRCIVGRRLCCLGVPQVTCKKPAPHLPDRFVREAPESFGRERQVGMDRQTQRRTSATQHRSAVSGEQKTKLSLVLTSCGRRQTKLCQTKTTT